MIETISNMNSRTKQRIDFLDESTWDNHSPYEFSVEVEKELLNGNFLTLPDCAINVYSYAWSHVLRKKYPELNIDAKRFFEDDSIESNKYSRELTLHNLILQKYKKIKDHKDAITRAEKAIHKAVLELNKIVKS